MGFAYKRELILKKIEARRDVVPLFFKLFYFLNYSIYHNAHYLIKFKYVPNSGKDTQKRDT